MGDGVVTGQREDGPTGFDVFLSHNTKDKAAVRELARALEQRGIRVWFDEDQLVPGMNAQPQLEKGIRGSNAAAVLIGKDGLGPWEDEEMQALLRLAMKLERRVTPVLLQGVADMPELPLFLANRIWVDLRSGLTDAELNRLVWGITGEAPRRTRHAADKIRNEKPSALPARGPGRIWNITEERNAHFTGRSEMLEALHAALSQGETAALTQAITGLGGVGKTTLALEYAYRYESEYEGVWWLHAEESATLARDYAELGPKLGIPAMADQGELIREVRQALSERKGVLLVFDNAANPELVKPYLPLGSGRRVIVTTRASTWPNATVQEVRELSPEAAVEFLHERTGQTDPAAAGDIVALLGGLPLALEQAAAYVDACKKSLHDYTRLLEAHGLRVLEKGRAYQYDQTVGTTWTLALEQVQESCPAAVDLLRLCAYLAPEAIDLPELAGAAKHLPTRLAQALEDELARDDARAALLRFSLIRAEGPVISVHRLVQQVTRERLTSQQQDEWLLAALRAVRDLFPFASIDVRNWPVCSRWLAHALSVTTGTRAVELDAGVCGVLLNQVALHLKSRAAYAEAEALYRRTLEIGEASLGLHHAEVAIRLNNLANLLRATNRLSEAEALYRRALEIDEARLGPHHPEVGTDLNNLAGLLRATNRLSEAEALYRRALEIDEASLGPHHPDVARDLNNLAGLLQATNRLSEAEPLYRCALEIWEASLGPRHPEVATALNNLALLLRATNRLSEAELLFRRALQITEVSLGPHHPNVANRLNNLATLLRDTDRLSEAEPLVRRALQILEVSLGSEHPHTVLVRENLERLLRETR